MKIVSWNVNGIRACGPKGFLQFIEREDPDIMCIQETKAHPHQVSDEFKLPLGRTGHWSSAEKKGYSGTATFLREPPLGVHHGIGIKKFDSEGRFVKTEHDGFSIYNVYFPNGGAREERHLYKQEFLKRFTAHLKKEMDAGQEIIVLGDYNVAYLEIDVHDPVRLSKVSGFFPEEREWFRKFLSIGFVDCFRKFHPDEEGAYTWWSYRERARIANRGWRIDHICVTPGLVSRVKSAKIHEDQTGSDHCPISIILD